MAKAKKVLVSKAKKATPAKAKRRPVKKAAASTIPGSNLDLAPETPDKGGNPSIDATGKSPEGAPAGQASPLMGPDLAGALSTLEAAGGTQGSEPKNDGAAPPSPAFTMPASILTGPWFMIFDYVANRYGEKWRLTELEADALAKATGPVLDKYMPAVASEHGEIIALGIVLAMTIGAKAVKPALPPKESAA